MPGHTLHVDKPDVGVISSDLFIYDYTQPGTGGLVTIVIPQKLDEREVNFVKTESIQVEFILSRQANTAEVILTRLQPTPTADRKEFQLVPEFQKNEKVSLTILFSEWKIIALIDGEPLMTLD